MNRMPVNAGPACHSSLPSSRCSLQDSNAVVSVANVHVLAFHHVLHIQRQVRLQSALISGDGSLFTRLAFAHDRGLVTAKRFRFEFQPATMHASCNRAFGYRLSPKPMHFGLELRYKLCALLREDVEQPSKLAGLDVRRSGSVAFLTVPARFDEIVQDIDHVIVAHSLTN